MDKKKIIEEMATIMADCYNTCDECFEKYEAVMTIPICDRENYCHVYLYAKRAVEAGYRKIPEGAVVIDKDENPCLSCPVPEDIQRDVDCSTICGAVRLGIDWKNQCRVLVKENKQLTKALAETRNETAKEILSAIKSALDEYRLDNEYFIEGEPNGNLWQMNASIFYLEVIDGGGLIDQIARQYGVEVE